SLHEQSREISLSGEALTGACTARSLQPRATPEHAEILPIARAVVDVHVVHSNPRRISNDYIESARLGDIRKMYRIGERQCRAALDRRTLPSQRAHGGAQLEQSVALFGIRRRAYVEEIT